MITVKCEGCSNHFNIFPYRLKRTRKFFCKYACRKGVELHKKHLEILCLSCGLVPVKQRSGRDVRFCSSVCYGNNVKKHFIIKKGYKRVINKTHHKVDAKGYVREHLLFMEQKLGRLLKECEVVHHVDGNKLNNSPNNLEVFSSQSEHMKWHRNNY